MSMWKEIIEKQRAQLRTTLNPEFDVTSLRQL